jgi:hypothetical protein
MLVILVLGIFLATIVNFMYYEYRVVKGLKSEPSYITSKYTNYLLYKKYSKKTSARSVMLNSEE